MGKFVCKCGQVISDVEYPSTSNGTLFTEESFDKFLSNAEALLNELKKVDSEGTRNEWIRNLLGKNYLDDATDSELHEDILSRHFENFSLSTLKCPTCGRFYIQKAFGVNEYTSFQRED